MLADVRVLKNLFSRARRKKKKAEVQSKLSRRENATCLSNFEITSDDHNAILSWRSQNRATPLHVSTALYTKVNV